MQHRNTKKDLLKENNAIDEASELVGGRRSGISVKKLLIVEQYEQNELHKSENQNKLVVGLLKSDDQMKLPEEVRKSSLVITTAGAIVCKCIYCSSDEKRAFAKKKFLFNYFEDMSDLRLPSSFALMRVQKLDIWLY